MTCSISLREALPAQCETLSRQNSFSSDMTSAGCSSQQEDSESYPVEQMLTCEPECMSLLAGDVSDASDASPGPQPLLTRMTTFTEYNEESSLEWKRDLDRPCGNILTSVQVEDQLMGAGGSTTEVKMSEHEDFQSGQMVAPADHASEHIYFDHAAQDTWPRLDLVPLDAWCSATFFQPCADYDQQANQAQLIERAQLDAQNRAQQEVQTKSKSKKGSQRKCLELQWGNATKRNSTTSKEWMCELLENLQVGSAKQAKAIASVRGSVLELSFDSTGTRVVQLALNVAGVEVASQLAAELQGHVLEAIHSPYGNYVIQEIIKMLPPSHIGFITDELHSIGGTVARHRYGCRILCRIVEHCAGEAGPAALISGILADAVPLIRHQYGHHVMESILQHGLPEQRQRVVAAICGDFHKNVEDRYASFVVDSSMVHCTPAEQATIVEGIQSLDPDTMGRLRKSQSRLYASIARASSGAISVAPEIGTRRMRTRAYAKAAWPVCSS